MHPDDLPGVLRRLVGDVVQLHDEGQQRQHQGDGATHIEIRGLQQFFRVIPGLFVIARADAPGHHRHHGEAQGVAGNALKGADRVADGVCRHGGSAQHGHRGQQQNFAQLEHTALHAVGHAEAQDVLHHIPVMTEAELFNTQGQAGPFQQDEHGRGRRQPGDQGGDGNALHAHMEAEDQKGIARHVDDVHEQGDPHGDLGIAHDPEQRRPGAVQRKERDGRFHDDVIGVGVSCHVRLHLAEHHPQHEALAQIEQHHDEEGRLPHKQQELLAGVSGFFRLPAAQILARDDGASGGQRREGVDQQNVHRIHQADGGNGRLAHMGDHDGVEQTHGDGQQLLDDQGHDEPPQVLPGKFNVDPPDLGNGFLGFHGMILPSFVLFSGIPGGSCGTCSGTPAGTWNTRQSPLAPPIS